MRWLAQIALDTGLRVILTMCFIMTDVANAFAMRCEQLRKYRIVVQSPGIVRFRFYRRWSI